MASSSLANPSAQTVAALLPKLHDSDPDHRFMSLNDLVHVLTVGRPEMLQSDYNTAARTVDGIIKSLDDGNGEVQNLAIKCLAPLVTKLPIAILSPLLEKLSLLNLENSVDNSIPAVALRTVVVTLPRPITGVTPGKDVVESYNSISKVLIPRLVGRVLVSKSTKLVQLPAPPPGMLDLAAQKDIDPEAVDVLIEVVRCFGPLLQPVEVEALHSLLVSILNSERTSSIVKKRAVVAVSILAVYLTDDELSHFNSNLIESLRAPHLTLVQRRLYITIFGSLARSIPNRFGPYLKILAPFVLSALSEQELTDQLENLPEDGEPDLETDEVREAALVALEGFLASCGSEMRSYTDEIISSALRFLKYDPNYNDDEDEEMGGTQADADDMDEFDDDDEFEADAGFDDGDDDASWKVRRCAAKVLFTLISTRGSGDLLDDGTLYSKVAPGLISRFREREENVRLEVIATLASLVRKTGEGALKITLNEEGADYVSQIPQGRKRRRQSSVGGSFDTKAALSLSAGLTSPAFESTPTSGAQADLATLTTPIIKATTQGLKGNSIPTKQALVNLLDEVVSVRNGGLAEHFTVIIDPIIEAIKTTSGSTGGNVLSSGGAASATANTLRISALKLVASLAKAHPSSVIQPFLPKIIPVVVAAVKDRYYKISSEAIVTVEQIIKALTPPRSQPVNRKHQSDIQQLFQVLVGRTSATDTDVEVRQRAIHALGILLACTASSEGSLLLSVADRAEGLDVLHARLKNETTRLAAVRAIDIVAALVIGKDLLHPKWIREVSLELSAQLRKANRALRGSSLSALKNLVTNPASRTALDPPTIEGLVDALIPLVNPQDLHLLGPALLILATLALDNSSLVVTPQLDSAICGIVSAPLGGSVLEAVLTLVTNIGQKKVGGPLMGGLLQNVSVSGDPAVVGKVIGTLLVAGSQSVGVSIDSFLVEAQNPGSDDARRSLALAVVGEAGLRMGLNSPLKPATFTAQFDAKSDKIPLAAAVALGRAGAGNPSVYLPEILDLLDKSGKVQYLLLHSIKEILQHSATSSTDLSKYTKGIWDHLLLASQAEDNKAVGAECIGRLTIIDPQIFVPKLHAYLKDKNPAIRAMVIQALRYALPDSDEAFDKILKANLVDMLTIMLRDTELENRRLALTTLNSAAHNKPDLIIPNLGILLPYVMRESEVKPELIREVMMGPFKHKVDDGLEVRKSAYETLYSLMENAFTRINILDFYDRIIAGLRDEHDIRALCNLMLSKLVILDIEETKRRLDSIAECFRVILSVKLKDNAVRQELEKQDEACKSVLRVSLLLHNAIPEAASGVGANSALHQGWRGYWEWVEKDFQGMLGPLKDENKELGL